MTLNSYFRFVVFMLMASAFLPVVFNNLPPVVGSHHLWTAIWGISLLISSPKVLKNKLIIRIFFYGLFLIIILKVFSINMDVWNRRMLIKEFYQIIIGASVISYFHYKQDYKGLAIITKWTLIFIFITAIMSIVSSMINPLYAREIISGAIERENAISFSKLGGGGYSAAISFMSLFPILIFYLKSNQKSIYSRKQIYAFVIVLVIALFRMNIFSNILIAILFGVVAVLGLNKIKRSVTIGFFVLILFVVMPRSVYVNVFVNISEQFEHNSLLNYKFNDVALFIEDGYQMNDDMTGVGTRASRYIQLMESFSRSPVFGVYYFSDANANGYMDYSYKNESIGYVVAGTHLYWMNKLTILGIVGFILFISIIVSHLKGNIRIFDKEYKFYYLLASLSIISYGIVKSLSGREVWYTFFIILPGIYYMQLLKKHNVERKKQNSKTNFNESINK